MAFTGVQFADDDGGTIALVRTSWLTPRKTEVFWPPYKTQEQFNKSLKKGDLPSECWTTYKISRIFFDSDDLGKAQRKVRQLEYTSDIQTDDPENTTFSTKRPRITPRRLYDSCSSDDDDNNNDSSTNKKQTIPRPPSLTKNSQDSVFVDSNVTSPKTQHLINAINSTQSDISSYSTPLSSRGSTPTSKESVRTSEQNKQILGLLNKKNISVNSVPVLQDFPVNFPLSNEEDLSVLEIYLKDNSSCDALASYFSAWGGKGLVSRVNIILKHCLSNALASNYSFYGKRTKKSFSGLLLKDVIIQAVQKGAPGSSITEIEDTIKTWLKHSPQRLKLEKKHHVQETA